MTAKNTPEKILAKLVEDGSGCWVWQGSKTWGGYGVVSYEGRSHPAHRLCYHFLVGPIPRGMVPDHLCGRRDCCNPAHLDIVTYAENNSRAARKRVQSLKARKAVTKAVTKSAAPMQVRVSSTCTNMQVEGMVGKVAAPLAQWQSNGLLKPGAAESPERCRR